MRENVVGFFINSRGWRGIAIKNRFSGRRTDIDFAISVARAARLIAAANVHEAADAIA